MPQAVNKRSETPTRQKACRHSGLPARTRGSDVRDAQIRKIIPGEKWGPECCGANHKIKGPTHEPKKTAQ